MNRTVRAAGAVNVGPGGRGSGMATATGGNGLSATKGWSPTVANLLVIIIVEIVVFAAIRYAFRVVIK